ncbi:MAG: DUF433 domain-containing protein [Cyanobacteria bacterium P01_F01_bin.86]
MNDPQHSKSALLERITQTPGKCGGRPCIREMRIRVSDILEMLADNVSASEILEDFPDLEMADIQACLLLSAMRGLGKEVWQGIDAQTYVNQERESWNR